MSLDQPPDPFVVQPRRDLLTEHPASRHDDLIVRWPNPDDGWLAAGWAKAAERIASTFTASASASASDDALLLPYLYLYRHAFELELKQAIRYAAQLRRLRGDDDRELEPKKVNKRLQHSHRHELLKLADEVDEHLAAFGLELLPARVREVLQLIASLDRVGEAFRYTGSLPGEQDSVAFDTLHATLNGAYQLVSVTQDVLSPVEEALGYEFEIRQEIEAEMRATYGDHDGYDHW